MLRDLITDTGLFAKSILTRVTFQSEPRVGYSGERVPGFKSCPVGADAALTRPLGAVRQVVSGRVLRAGVRRGGEDVLKAASGLRSADLCL